MSTIRRLRRTPAAGRVHSPRRTARRIALTLIALVLLGAAGSAISLYAKGYRVWVVHTGSMEPTYMPGDIVVDRPPSGHYAPGEAITFRHSDLTSDVVTHRVTNVTPAGLIHTKGDANRTADVWDIRPDQVQGSVMFKLKYVGYALVFLRQPAGAGVLASVIFAIVILWGLFFPAAAEGSTEDGMRRKRGAHRSPQGSARDRHDVQKRPAQPPDEHGPSDIDVLDELVGA